MPYDKDEALRREIRDFIGRLRLTEVTGDSFEFFREVPLDETDDADDDDGKKKVKTMGEIIDRFGRDITTYACDQQSFRVITTVGLGPAFYSWVFSLQGRVKLREPETVCQEYKSMINKAAESVNLAP